MPNKSLKVFVRGVFLLVFLLLITSCSTTQRTSSNTTQLAPYSFAWWHLWHQGDVENFTKYLEAQGVSGVLPMSQLLRSASSWEECSAEPFVVPPQQQWEAAASVLRLLQFLESSGVITSHIEVYSGYRNPLLNACANGAAGSAHTRSFALDFKPLGPVDPAAALCNFWRTKGKKWNMGFSIYPSGRIHIDTARYRTWGYDHTGKSAVCSAT
jgi:hypothetical protein